MVTEIPDLLDEYWTWLRDKTTVRDVDDWSEITTPFLDRHNDSLQIYVRRDGDRYLLTDDGYTIIDLEQSGSHLDTPKRSELLRLTLRGFGVQNNGKALEVHASRRDFALKKHNLVQAMLAVNDLFYLAAPHVETLFYEDVTTWLDEADIRYTPQLKLTGLSGFDHRFDFVIPKSSQQPERVLRTITRPARQTAESIAFAWVDTKDARADDARAYAILNDQRRGIQNTVLDALERYEVHSIRWSERDVVVEELAA